MSLSAAVIGLTLAYTAPPQGWQTCGGLDPLYNRTACPTDNATCCTQKWMPDEGNWGCCPYPDAVCCPGGYTCCPSGTTCQNSGSSWDVVSYCVKPDGTKSPPGLSGGGQEVCKTGAPFPFNASTKNVIIMGDSVSIGYTPFVASALSDVAFVQHSPWGGDGGAEETRYGWKCLEYLLSAPDGTPQRPDLIYFNWGLHNTGKGSTDNNTGNGVVPGQSGRIVDYEPYLDLIANRLGSLRPQTKIIFGITTPMMCSGPTDTIVMQLNGIAKNVMMKYNIPTVDMHSAITGHCGPAPNTNCFNQTNCFCPHCPNDGGIGYSWLTNTTIAPAIRKALADN